MLKFARSLAGLVVLGTLAFSAAAQTLPVNVTVSGNTATARIGLASAPVADLTLSFDDASGLSAAALGISAELVDIADPLLLARLPDPSLTGIPSALPLLVTIEPPALGGLSFKRTAHVELHTHALAYSAGTRLRLFKAPLGGDFRDITDDVLPGSVRSRGTVGGFSQFLILVDLRPSDGVVADKFAHLYAGLSTLPLAEQTALSAMLDAAAAAVTNEDYGAAIAQLDAFGARVAAHAGNGIPDQWRAQRDLDNRAGDLLAGAATLKFGIGYLRDYGN